MRKYLTKRTESSVVDSTTGEISTITSTTEVIKQDAEPFFLTYSRQIVSLYDLPFFNITTKVFWKLLEYAEFNTGKVFMNANRKKEIMQIGGVSKTSYYRAIEELTKAEIISKDGDTYTINEDMFWKGDRKEREKLKTAKMKLSMSAIFNEI